MLECIEGKQIFTSGTTSVTATGASHYMPECNHEEAGTRMLIHLQDALENGATTCLVRTVDTDVIVIIVGKLHYLHEQHPAAYVWIASGTGRNFRYLHINAICNALRREKAIALPIFHSVTTSTFLGKGKKSAWDALKAFPEVTKLFLYMASNPHVPLNIEYEEFKLLECFCVIIYDKTSSLEYVNEARRELFCQKNRTMETIPPTQNAFLQHCRRAALLGWHLEHK